MFYAAMANSYNHTRIELNPIRLTVQHGPFPWPGGKRFSIRDIGQLCAEAGKVHAKGRTINVYRVMVARKNGKKSKLLAGLEMSESQMNFIVGALNEYLLALQDAKGR
jgi:hypothetical protein